MDSQRPTMQAARGTQRESPSLRRRRPPWGAALRERRRGHAHQDAVARAPDWRAARKAFWASLPPAGRRAAGPPRAGLIDSRAAAHCRHMTPRCLKCWAAQGIEPTYIGKRMLLGALPGASLQRAAAPQTARSPPGGAWMHPFGTAAPILPKRL